MGLFDSAGREAGQKAVETLGPIMHEVENRGAGILHGLLDRLNGTKLTIVTTITFEIPPLPKATLQ